MQTGQLGAQLEQIPSARVAAFQGIVHVVLRPLKEGLHHVSSQLPQCGHGHVVEAGIADQDVALVLRIQGPLLPL